MDNAKLTDRDLMILGIVFGFRTTKEFEGFAHLQEAKHQARVTDKSRVA
jgi:hypothetical protein